MPVTIASVIVDTDDPTAAGKFTAALGLSRQVLVRATEEPSEGFRGYTLGLVVKEPVDVDAYVTAAESGGGAVLKAPTRSLWGYGAALRSPDGSVWTVASSAKRNSGRDGVLAYDDLVLLLGVADVKATKRFYSGQGLAVGKSFAGKYVEFSTSGITLAAQPRSAAARTAGVDPAAPVPPGLTVVGSAGVFTDPDGFSWTEERGTLLS